MFAVKVVFFQCEMLPLLCVSSVALLTSMSVSAAISVLKDFRSLISFPFSSSLLVQWPSLALIVRLSI